MARACWASNRNGSIMISEKNQPTTTVPMMTHRRSERPAQCSSAIRRWFRPPVRPGDRGPCHRERPHAVLHAVDGGCWRSRRPAQAAKCRPEPTSSWRPLVPSAPGCRRTGVSGGGDWTAAWTGRRAAHRIQPPVKLAVLVVRHAHPHPGAQRQNQDDHGHRRDDDDGAQAETSESAAAGATGRRVPPGFTTAVTRTGPARRVRPTALGLSAGINARCGRLQRSRKSRTAGGWHPDRHGRSDWRSGRPRSDPGPPSRLPCEAGEERVDVRVAEQVARHRREIPDITPGHVGGESRGRVVGTRPADPNNNAPAASADDA